MAKKESQDFSADQEVSPSDKKAKGDDKTAPAASHITLARLYEKELKKKLEKSKENKEKVEKTLEQWEERDDRQKRSLVVKNIKAKLKSPFNLLKKLQSIGTDIQRGVQEDLRQYRIDNMVEAYASTLNKLNTALSDLSILVEDHPDLIEEAGGFYWELANPMPIKSDNGLFLIETEDGTLEDALLGSED